MSIHAKLWEIQKELEPVRKNGFNSFHKYKYVTKEDILASIAPLCSKHEVAHYVSVVDSAVVDGGASVKVELHLVDAAEAQSVITVSAPGFALDKNGDKAVYKAITGASKYAYMQAFGLSTDDDPENDSSDEIKKASENYKKAEREATGVSEDEQKAVSAFLKTINQTIKEYGFSKELVTEITGYDTLKGLDSHALANVIDCLFEYISVNDLTKGQKHE